MILNKKIVNISPPYTHLIMGTNVELKKFYNKLNSFDNVKIIIINGTKCQKVDELFNEFASAFQFPNYFGNNWAAFDECINDLDWLQAEAYILIIGYANDVLNNSDKDFETFIKILSNAINEWTKGRNYDSFPTPPTTLHIIFHCTEENKNELKLRLEKAGLENVEIINKPIV